MLQLTQQQQAWPLFYFFEREITFDSFQVIHASGFLKNSQSNDLSLNQILFSVVF
jgi:hypothetical protein